MAKIKTNAAEKEKPDKVQQFLANQMQYWATYHHHKEQMAFGAAALYLTGSAALSFLGIDPIYMNHFVLWLCMIFFLLLTGIIGIAFVYWQLGHRAFAAEMVRTYGLLSIRWLNNSPGKDDLDEAKDPEGRPIANGVLRVYNKEVKDSYDWFQGPNFATALTLVTMVFWGIAAFLRVAYIGFTAYCIGRF